MSNAVLIVEDDHSVAVVLQRLLSRLSLGVECVGTGLEALGRINQGGIDLVLLDLGLPDIDGTDVCRQARTDGYTGPILVLSARHGRDVSAEALTAGADSYMPKPFAIRDLEARARALLG